MITETAVLTAIAALAALTIVLIHRRRMRQQTADRENACRTRLEEEMRLARDERQRLLDGLGDAFLLLDPHGVVRFANAAAQRLLGARESVGRSLREVFVDPRLAAPVARCLGSGLAEQVRLELPQQASPLGDLETRGNNCWQLDVARLPASPGQEPLTRVILRDMTAEHQIEQIRKDFVANASHELRTPMAIINGYLENLLEEGMLEDPVVTRRFLSVMRKHAERISRIVEDMLVISRLESGEANTLRIESFRFRSCVHDVLERLESVIRMQDASVALEMRDESLVMHADRFYWTQVLFNLVENALKQNPRRGLRVAIGCEADGELLRLWVADNGIGIPTADLPHIFRRFYRVEKHHSQGEIKGTGLGLSIVKRAVEAHGGTIAVTSSPGRETKFLITVPRGCPAQNGEGD